MKARALLSVERAKALVGGARLLQLNALADHVDDVQPGLDLGRDSACQPTSGSVRSFVSTLVMTRRFSRRLTRPARRRKQLRACQVLTGRSESILHPCQALDSEACQYPQGVSGEKPIRIAPLQPSALLVLLGVQPGNDPVDVPRPDEQDIGRQRPCP